MNRLVRILPLAVLLLGACSEPATAPSEPAFATAGTRIATFTRCDQPYGLTSAWIGPRGGRLKAGGHVLYIPPGALSTTVFITMETPSGNIGHAVLSPEGLTFNSTYPAHLMMSYQSCLVTPEATQQVAYTTESLKIVETQPSVTDPVTLTVDAKLSHFSDYVLLSTYAVAY